jgi:hypothetical protein
LSDACQHAFDHVWCISVPARIQLAIQTSFRESVVGEEWDYGGARCSMCLYSTRLNLKLSTKLLGTLIGLVLARILSYTTPDACQHALGSVWCICVPARIHLAIQTSLRESVVGEEWDNEGARNSMGECSICLNLKLSLNLLVTLLGCVLARILSNTSSDAGQHTFGHAWCICVPEHIHLAIQTHFRESVVGGERDDGGALCSMCLYSICLNLKLSTNLRVTGFGCVHTRKRSYTTPDACQHACDFAWSICVPAHIQLVIQISLREIVGGDEGDGERARYSMEDYSICLNLKLSSYLPVTLFECVLARILSYILSHACQHALRSSDVYAC